MMRRILSVLALFPLAVIAFPAAAQADVEDFTFSKWDQQIQLDLDGEGRAVAHITETVVADFPDFDQNRGMVRYLLEEYRGAWIGPHDLSVQNAAGEPVPFETESEDGKLAVLTGTNEYVQGPQTYVISYTYRDVVHVPDDANIDEFYWDLLPLDRPQVIGESTTKLTFAPQLAGALTGPSACMGGTENSKTPCELNGPEMTADGSATFRISATEIAPYAGMSVAFELAPGTVTQPDSRIPNFAADVLPMGIAAGGVAVAGIGALLTTRMRRKARTATGIVVAQYDVPDWISPLIVPSIVEGTKTPVPAEFIHLAVRGAMRIEDGEKKKQPVFRLLDAAKAPDPIDLKALNELFGTGSAPGSVLVLPTSSEAFSAKMTALTAAAKKDAQQRGLLEGRRSPGAAPLGITALVLAGVGLAIPAIGVANDRVSASAAFAIGIVALVITAILAIVQFVKWPVHTATGAETREYLLGVREFIRVAEADRMRVLQSYTGAERQELDGAQVVHIYERLLPYAMLFGLEKEWGKVLQLAYEREHTSPLWYPGMAGVGAFNQSLSAFSRTVGSSAAYSSSSSSGSGGGGFSGGGGGGGGAGGR